MMLASLLPTLFLALTPFVYFLGLIQRRLNLRFAFRDLSSRAVFCGRTGGRTETRLHFFSGYGTFAKLSGIF